jgi:hypothetical protein
MYAQSWNVGIQRDLGKSLFMSIGYNGTKGTRLDVQIAPNTAAPGGSPLTSYQRLQIGNAVGFTYDLPVGNSILHSGNISINRRFKNNISGGLFYTLSKTIDDSSTLGGTVVQNPFDISAERALSNSDRRHSISSNFTWQTPVGGPKGYFPNRPALRDALKDWTLNGNVQLTSGRPFTAQVLGNLSDTGGTGTLGAGRAEATGLPVDAGSGYFNVLAFTTPPSGQFGNAGRNTIPGPWQFSTNAQVSRTFSLNERKRIVFNVSASNLLNHVNITGIGTVVNSLNYGLATAAGGMRTATISLRFMM